MTSTIDPTREISHQRTLNAPRDLVFRMWSNPVHLDNWWGPQGFSTETYEFDFKEGGYWRFTMIGPDGKRYPNNMRYTRIAPDCIEYEHSGEGEIVDFKVTVSLLEKGDKTEMNWRLVFPTTEARDRVITMFGADKGLVSTIGRLDELVVTQDKGAIELAIVRRYKASLQAVYDAWTAPGAMSKWACPAGFEMLESTGDVRVGGRWSFRMASPEVGEFAAHGEYTEVTPPTRLRFTHQWDSPGRERPVTEVSVSFLEKDGQTTMTFVQTGFEDAEVRDAHVDGWSQSFDKLTEFLA